MPSAFKDLRGPVEVVGAPRVDVAAAVAPLQRAVAVPFTDRGIVRLDPRAEFESACQVDPPAVSGQVGQ